MTNACFNIVKRNKKILVFDVESISLFGEAFAVGAVIGDLNGNISDFFSLKAIKPQKKANEWVKANVLPNISQLPSCNTTIELRTAFYEWYMKFKDICTIWSDVNFPVETNFLSAIVKDDPETRQFNMPYPLYDISNFIDIRIDRIESCKMKILLKHNPLDDSMASYYCLTDYINTHKKSY